MKRKLLSMMALAALTLLPQGAWADATKTLTPETDVLYSLMTTGDFGTDNGDGTFTKDGIVYEKSSVSNNDDNHDPKWWRYQANSAYIGCPLESALAAGDVIEITARASSASSSLYFILRDNTSSEVVETDINVALGSTSEKTYTYTVTAGDNLVGKSKIYLMANFPSGQSYKIRVGLIRVLRNRTTPNPITRSTTWDFTEYNTASETTAPIVCDNLYFGTGIQIMNQKVDGDYNVVNLNGAKGAEDDTHSLIFYVPAGSGKFTIEFIPNSGNSSSHSKGKKAYYKIGDNDPVLMEYTSGKTLNTLSDVAYNVATATPIMLYTTATGQYLIKSISVTPNAPTIPITTIDYATFSSPLDLDFSACSQKAYIVTGESAGTLTYQQVTKVPAGTGLLLVGAAGENVTPAILSDDADDVTGNLLKPTLTATTVGTTEGADYGKVFILGNKGGVPGFYKSDNGRSLVVGKAYLYLESGISEAREFFAFNFGDGETTGIYVPSDNLNAKANYFDLQGRKVAQPTKGLYIVNGKKVVIR